jgi:hypothetical protein
MGTSAVYWQQLMRLWLSGCLWFFAVLHLTCAPFENFVFPFGYPTDAFNISSGFLFSGKQFSLCHFLSMYQPSVLSSC